MIIITYISEIFTFDARIFIRFKLIVIKLNEKLNCFIWFSIKLIYDYFIQTSLNPVKLLSIKFWNTRNNWNIIYLINLNTFSFTFAYFYFLEHKSGNGLSFIFQIYFMKFVLFRNYSSWKVKCFCSTLWYYRIIEFINMGK